MSSYGFRDTASLANITRYQADSRMMVMRLFVNWIEHRYNVQGKMFELADTSKFPPFCFEDEYVQHTESIPRATG